MHRGYTKSWRKRWDKDYCKDHLLFTMMHYFIDHANWKDTDIFFPNIGNIPLKRGDHIFSTTKLSIKLGVDRQRIRTKLKILEKIGFLTRQSTNRYTIISVTNYGAYQSDDESANQPSNQHLTSIQPAANQQLTTDKKDKNIKKVKKVKKKAPGTFVPTSKEILNDASIRKINLEIDTVSEKLYKKKIFPKVHAFKNQMLKKGQNERAILHALSRCYLARKKLNGDAWAYCTKIMQVENGNYNESDHNKTT